MERLSPLRSACRRTTWCRVKAILWESMVLRILVLQSPAEASHCTGCSVSLKRGPGSRHPLHLYHLSEKDSLVCRASCINSAITHVISRPPHCEAFSAAEQTHNRYLRRQPSVLPNTDVSRNPTIAGRGRQEEKTVFENTNFWEEQFETEKKR